MATRFRPALLGLLLLTGAGPALAGPITRVIAFGDSNVDIGRAYALNPATVPAPNVNGRYSNGPLVVDYVATRLGVPLTSYGVAGAWSGTDNNFRIVGGYTPDLANTGVLNQLDWWDSDRGPAGADPDALYLYWAGSNDLFGADAGNLQGRIDGVKANLTTAMQRLDAAGARRIMVATRTPREVLGDANDLRGQALNAELRALVPLLDAAYGARIELFDAYEVIADLMRDPAANGFLTTSAFCSASAACYGDQAVADTYINWDGAHKTTRVLSLTADALLAQVPLPGTLPLVLLALGTLGLIRRRR